MKPEGRSEMHATKDMSSSATVVSESEEYGDTVNELLLNLHSHEWKVRQSARWRLVTLRDLAVFPLMDALQDPDWHVRWEAAKALHDIADPRAAPALILALRDRRFAVRWLASNALIALGEASLPALLEALVHDADSLWLREGAHHVLRDLMRGHVRGDVSETVKPVVDALEKVEPTAVVPFAARKALDALPKRVRRKAG
jgi:HEAT repeat protein